MAVQAQYQSDAFSPDFRNRIPSNNSSTSKEEELQNHQMGSLLGAYTHHLAREVKGKIMDGSVFGDPESGLTCNAFLAAAASGSRRKRNREEHTTMVQPHFQFASPAKMRNRTAAATISTGLHEQQNRLQGSAGTSTSGRPITISPHLVYHLDHQGMEIDALIQQQNEKLRSGLDEIRKRHYRGLFSALEQQVAKRLEGKEADLARARETNAELEEKVRQMAVEGQFWFNIAQKNEAIAASLRASLEHALAAGSGQATEGYGENADDAESCCFGERENQELRCRRTCRLCREKDVSVVLLPCRHLCVCDDCEPAIETCPFCHSTKHASIQIFMS